MVAINDLETGHEPQLEPPRLGIADISRVQRRGSSQVVGGWPAHPNTGELPSFLPLRLLLGD